MADEYITTLDEGRATLLVPERLSADSAKDFEDWLVLILRKLKRRVEKSASEVTQQPGDGRGGEG